MFSFLHRKPPIEDLWQWFGSNRQRLEREGGDEHALRQLSQWLRNIEKGLTFDIRRDGTAHELEISADGIPELISSVREIIGKAPEIKGWTFVAFRQPRPVPVEIDVYDQVLTADNVHFVVDEVKPESVDLTVYVPNLTDENYRHMAHCAMMIIESIIGEYDLMTRIEELDYLPYSEAPAQRAQPLRDLARALAEVFNPILRAD